MNYNKFTSIESKYASLLEMIEHAIDIDADNTWKIDVELAKQWLMEECE